MSDFLQTYDFWQHTVQTLEAMRAHWNQHCADEEYEEWELEVRLGTVPATPEPTRDRQQLVPVHGYQQDAIFDTGIDPTIFLGTFDHLCSTGEALNVTDCAIDYVAEHKERGSRTVHQTPSRRKSVEKVGSAQNFKRMNNGILDVRLSSTVERRLPQQAARPSEWPPLNTVKRERRSIVLTGAEFWRIDFTRLDGGMRHQIEIELLWPHTYVRLYRRFTDCPSPLQISFQDFLAYTVMRQLLSVLDRIERAVHVVQRC